MGFAHAASNPNPAVVFHPPPVRNALLKLPVFRPVALKMLRLMTNDQLDVQSLADLLRTDPGLTARLLAVANSVLYGNAQRIDSLARAILVLGLERTKSLALTLALHSFLRHTGDAQAMERCWQHSMATAMLAEEFAPLFQAGKDEAYTAALLHDIGRLGLLMAYGEEYQPVLTARHASACACLEAERDIFKMDHCQAGLWLTQHWEFPPAYSRVASCHHDDLTAPKNDLISLVQVACRMADALGFAAVAWQQPPSTEEVAARLPVQPWTRYRFQEAEARARIAQQIAGMET